MKKTLQKLISLDGDTLELLFTFDEELSKYFGVYPDFSEAPRYTPSGRPWVNVTNEDCPYSEGEFKDCGSCSYLIKQCKKDLIGVCTNEMNRRDVTNIHIYNEEESIL